MTAATTASMFCLCFTVPYWSLLLQLLFPLFPTNLNTYCKTLAKRKDPVWDSLKLQVCV